jgi:hypothetical protein
MTGLPPTQPMSIAPQASRRNRDIATAEGPMTPPLLEALHVRRLTPTHREK